MSKELEQIVLLGDGVLVRKQNIENKIGSIHLPDGAAADELLPMHECEVVAVGPGDQKPLNIEIGDVAMMPRGPQYAQVKVDNQIFFIIAQQNILYLKRKSKNNT